MRSHITRVSALLALSLSAAPAATAAEGCGASGRFVVAGGEFTDTTTRLTWQRCSNGLTWSTAGGCVGTIAPVTFGRVSDVVAQAGSGWRLPTADELYDLLDETCHRPAADATAMPDIPLDPSGEPSIYWTSTEAGFEDMMVTVDFRYGFADMHSKGLSFFLRLVRSAS